MLETDKELDISEYQHLKDIDSRIFHDTNPSLHVETINFQTETGDAVESTNRVGEKETRDTIDDWTSESKDANVGDAYDWPDNDDEPIATGRQQEAETGGTVAYIEPVMDHLPLPTTGHGVNLTLQIPETRNEDYSDDFDSSASSSLSNESTSSTSGVLVINPEGSLNQIEEVSTTPGSDVPDLVPHVREKQQDLETCNDMNCTSDLKNNLDNHSTVIMEHQNVNEQQQSEEISFGQDSEQSGEQRGYSDEARLHGTEDKNLRFGQKNEIPHQVNGYANHVDYLESSEEIENEAYNPDGGYRESLLDSETTTGATSETQTLDADSDLEVRKNDLDRNRNDTGTEDDLNGTFTLTVSSNLDFQNSKKFQENEPKTPEEVLKFIGIIKPTDIMPYNTTKDVPSNLTISKPDVWNSMVFNNDTMLFPVVETQVSEPKGMEDAVNGIMLSNGEASKVLSVEDTKRYESKLNVTLARTVAEAWSSSETTVWNESSKGNNFTKLRFQITNEWNSTSVEGDEIENNRNTKLNANIDRADGDQHVTNGSKWQSEIERELEHHTHYVAMEITENSDIITDSKTNERNKNHVDEYAKLGGRKRNANFGSENELESLECDFTDMDVFPETPGEKDIDWEVPVELNKSKENKALKGVNSIIRGVNDSSSEEEYDLQGSKETASNSSTCNSHLDELPQTTGVRSPDSSNFHFTQSEEHDPFDSHVKEFFDQTNKYNRLEQPKIKEQEPIERDRQKHTLIRLASVEENVLIGLDLPASEVQEDVLLEESYVNEDGSVIDGNADQLSELIEQTSFIGTKTENTRGSEESCGEGINDEKQHETRAELTTCDVLLNGGTSGSDITTTTVQERNQNQSLQSATQGSIDDQPQTQNQPNQIQHKNYTDLTYQQEENVITNEIRDHLERGVTTCADSNIGDNTATQLCDGKNEEYLDSYKELNTSNLNESLSGPGSPRTRSEIPAVTDRLNSIEDPQLEVIDSSKRQCGDIDVNEEVCAVDSSEESANSKSDPDLSELLYKSSIEVRVKQITVEIDDNSQIELHEETLDAEEDVYKRTYPGPTNETCLRYCEETPLNNITDEKETGLNGQNCEVNDSSNSSPIRDTEASVYVGSNDSVGDLEQHKPIKDVNSIGHIRSTSEAQPFPYTGSDIEHTTKADKNVCGFNEQSDGEICEVKIEEIKGVNCETATEEDIISDTQEHILAEFKEKEDLKSKEVNLEESNEIYETKSEESVKDVTGNLPEDKATVPKYLENGAGSYCPETGECRTETREAIVSYVAEIIDNAVREVISAKAKDEKVEKTLEGFGTNSSNKCEIGLNDTVNSAISEVIGQLFDGQFSDSDDGGDDDNDNKSDAEREIEANDIENNATEHKPKHNLSLDLDLSLNFKDEGQLEQIDSFPSDLSELEGFAPRSDFSGRTYDSESITSYDSLFDGAAFKFVVPDTIQEHGRTVSVLTEGSSVDFNSSSSSESGVSEFESQQQLEALCEAEIEEASKPGQGDRILSVKDDQDDLFSSSASVIENEEFAKRPKLQKSPAIDDQHNRDDNELSTHHIKDELFIATTDTESDIPDCYSQSDDLESPNELYTSQISIILNIPDQETGESCEKNWTIPDEADIHVKLEHDPDQDLELVEETTMDGREKRNLEDQGKTIGQDEDDELGTLETDKSESEMPRIPAAPASSGGEIPRTSTPTPGGQHATNMSTNSGLFHLLID